MDTHDSLHEAKTRLSSLVDRAAAGEEIVISKNGLPCAKLVPIEMGGVERKPANGLNVTYIADDFDAVDPVITDMFDGNVRRFYPIRARSCGGTAAETAMRPLRLLRIYPASLGSGQWWR